MISRSFSEDEVNSVKSLLANGKSISEIAVALGRSYDSVCSFIRRGKFQNNTKSVEIEDCAIEKHQKLSVNSKGERTIENMISIVNGEDITVEKAMEMHGLKPQEWEVVSFSSNSWEVSTKTGKKTNTQYKITVKPKISNELTFEDIDAYFDNKGKRASKVNMPSISANGKCETLEIDYADAHCGLLSWAQETGSNYDLQIVRERFSEIIDDIIARAKGRKFNKIIFATLGDILHIDNSSNTTTAGTPQSADGRVPKIFNTALDMMIETIDKLLTLKTPIEYIFVQGNHSRNLEYCLAKSLELAYRNNANITFNVAPNPQKAVVVGENLIGLCHGDIPKKNLGKWLQRDFRKEYGNTKFAEVHCGHLHEEAVKSDGGVLVKTLPAICESSNWEHEQGYSANRGVMCFVWDNNKGLRETWYNYI